MLWAAATEPHNHPSNEDDIEVIRAVAALKKRIAHVDPQSEVTPLQMLEEMMASMSSDAVRAKLASREALIKMMNRFAAKNGKKEWWMARMKEAQKDMRKEYEGRTVDNVTAPFSP